MNRKYNEMRIYTVETIVGVLTAVLLTCTSPLAEAQAVSAVAPVDAAGLVSIKEVVYDKVGTFFWDRPASVRFAILLGCGGGSGGGGSGIRARGKQGVGAPVLTTIVGPLEEPRYQIEIGDGGTGGISWRRTEPGNDGENGRETSFESSVGAHPIKINFPGASMAAPIWNQVLNLSRGAEGGPGQPQMIDAHMHPGGFGGLPGIGDGGHGSPANVAGGTGGSCAGGAAAGELSQPDMGVPYGGHGGAGYLMIVPLVDASIVEQRFQSILLELAEASKAAHP